MSIFAICPKKNSAMMLFHTMEIYQEGDVGIFIISRRWLTGRMLRIKSLGSLNGPVKALERHEPAR
ncbi:MAG: hypothetical protein ACLQUS_00490 [Desulfobaccales bacterium]